MSDEIYHVGGDRCGDLVVGQRLEWLETNGRGGFAMGTVHQMLTRRYHGLLVAAIDPPVERFVLLAKLEAAVTIGDATYELGTNDFGGGDQPQGCRFLEAFDARPYPTWRWRVEDALIEQTLCMIEGEDTVFVRYRMSEGHGSLSLAVRPMCSSRHFHSLPEASELGTPAMEVGDDWLTLNWPDGRPSWRLGHNGSFVEQPNWYYRFVLPVEARRGYDSRQDLFVPGSITATLRPDDSSDLVVMASTQDRSWRDWPAAFDRQAAAEETPPPPETNPQSAIHNPQSLRPVLDALRRAAEAFIVSRGEGLKTVIAGYPWFGDWGRDTFIALPGLCLVTGRLDDARKIIEAFAGHVNEGMIPNRFPDYGEPPAYNTVDATLWYIHAIDRYLAYSGDWNLVADRLFDVVAEILEAHYRGTRHGIRLCDDGLLAAGEPGIALTWMDAQLPGRSITPRIGKPVEINALWHNALRVATGFAERLGMAQAANRWRGLAERGRAIFNQRFWDASTGRLFDVVDVDGMAGKVDAATRPNQLLAISLTHPVLDESRWSSVVGVCRRELLTPLGMRTLSPEDRGYQGRYAGELAERDAAYHQGTVWPWLLGPYVTAYVKSLGSTAEARADAGALLAGLAAHLGESGIGGISEVADGDPPHAPGGCPWQAWSVAEPLRALCEDVLRTHSAGCNASMVLSQ